MCASVWGLDLVQSSENVLQTPETIRKKMFFSHYKQTTNIYLRGYREYVCCKTG